jgi:hypothetical protein
LGTAGGLQSPGARLHRTALKLVLGALSPAAPAP